MSFFFNDTATTEIYTLSLHDALPISPAPLELGLGLVARELAPGAMGQRPQSLGAVGHGLDQEAHVAPRARDDHRPLVDRKSTHLNSSHANISYAVFCLKKKKIN